MREAYVKTQKPEIMQYLHLGNRNSDSSKSEELLLLESYRDELHA